MTFESFKWYFCSMKYKSPWRIQDIKFGDGDGPNLCRVNKVDVSFLFIENIFRSGLTLVSCMSNEIIISVEKKYCMKYESPWWISENKVAWNMNPYAKKAWNMNLHDKQSDKLAQQLLRHGRKLLKKATSLQTMILLPTQLIIVSHF